MANSIPGQLTVKFPAYIVTQYDEPDRKVTISVADPEIKHQKSMWGMMVTGLL